MNDIGMAVSQFDPCVFIGDRLIAVESVDDILFHSIDENFPIALGTKLREQGLLLEEEDDAQVNNK